MVRFDSRYGSGSNSLDFVVAPVTSLTARAAQDGTNVAVSMSQDQTEAITTAKGKDIAIVFANA